MSKHPVPWTVDCMGYILDAKGMEVARLETHDPETRAVLLHAGEMFAALRDFCDCGRSDFADVQMHYAGLLSTMQAEIAAGRKP